MWLGMLFGMSGFVRYASVILDQAVGKTLDYGVPMAFDHLVKRGVRVEVPLRGRVCGGYVFEVKETVDFKVKPIKRILSETELITDDLFELALWISSYYCAPLNQVVKSMFPASIRKEIKPKQQLFVMRKKTKDELRQVCSDLRNKSSAQANVLDVMLKVKKGILLSELLEETGGSRSPVDTLVKKGCLLIDIVRIDRSPLVNEEYFMSRPKVLGSEQQESFDKIVGSTI